MKIKNVNIGIKSVEEGLKEFAGVVNDARRGRFPKKPLVGVYFTSIEDMRKVLTVKRLELLHLIRELEPESIYQLARAAKRDLKNVQNDVALLARIDLVQLSRSKTRRDRVIPRVGYDRLQLQISMV